ncbi:hypothetical protein BGW38_007415 [Lunasporangiospora selenospora]|uniref:DH domain-containing protein n=1 Tax=Lunasporangiospora selenospora TaxID=979761 RepID=A0A9P6KI10_9FUNG|nr:hypothetical protein BGW38_007415 [Lunasporangiospora selenospora]
MDLQTRRMTKPGIKDYRLSDIRTVPTTATTAKPRRASLCHLNHPRVTPCPIKALLDLNPVSQYRPPRHGEEPGVDPLHKSLRTSRSCAKPISARDSLGRSGSISASTRASGHTHRPYRGAGAEPGPQGNVSILAARHGVIGTSETLPMSSTWGIDFRGPTPGLPFGGVTHRVSDAGETKRFEKRSHALRELETTEESYVNDLDILINIHLRVLESKAWFPPVLHGNIIRCARGLLVIQQKFLSHLADNKLSMMEEEKKAPLVVYKRLCEAFEGLSQERAIYSTFCELRMRILATIERSAVTVMAQFKKECGEMMTAQGRPRSRYELKDYLIKPIQRVCRYPLLLKEVLRLTDSSDPEYRYIERAHRTMKDMAQDIDDTQRSVERLLLTERLLKKLPETSFPRKLVFSSGPSQTNGTNGSGLHAQNNSVSSTQPMNMGTRNNSSDFKPLHHSSEFQSNGGNTSVSSKSTGIQETSLLRGSGSGGIVPSALTRAFMGTLGSIVLAGTLECILIPNDPVRFKYYGCFLFESMIVIVKAKKSNLYEPRQWLPLRLCELQEQKRSEGHTQFGWRVVFDRFRIEFGASSTAEQQIWVKTLRERIQASKEAYASLPRDIAAFETLVSSLPWRTSKPQCLSCQLAKNILYQPPSPSPSPWSLSSSSIPSPLMPPPPSGISSTTLMMAMPYDPALESDQHGAIRTTTLVEGCSCSHHESGPWDSLKEISMGLHREKRPHSVKHLSSGYKEGRGIGGMANCGDRANDDHSENPGLLRRSHSQPQAPNDHRAFPDSTQYYQLQPSNSVPWLMPDSRHRNGFDVSKVFASGHAAIKPNHRALVQTMFKDLSAEAIWTTSADSLPAPPPALAASPLVRRPSKYGGSAQSLNYAPPTNTSAPLSTKATGSRSSVLAGMAGFPMAAASPDHDGSNTDMTGSSLSSKLLRHKDYGSGTRLYVNTIVEVPDNAECDRKKMSATASIAATLASSFRKHSEAPNRGSGKGCGDMNYPQSTAKSQEHKSGLGSKFSTTAKSTDKRTLSSDNIASSQFSDGLGSTSTEPSIIKSSQSCKELRSLVVDTTPGKTSRLCSLDNDDTLTSLNSAAEAAKSRRGTGERGAKRSPGGTDSPTKLLVSSTSLPLSVKSDDLNTIQDFTPSTPPAEVALSRQYPDKIEKRRSDGFLDRSATGYHHSNNSYPALPSLQQVSSPRSTDNMTSSNPRQVPGERQCSRYGLSKFKETIDSNGLPVDGPMSASAPNTGSMSGWRWCPQYNTPPSRASHSRTTSSCTERSMGLEFNPASSHEDKIGRQRLSMTPSASVTSCSSSSLYCPSPRSLSYSSPSPQRNLQRTMDNVNAIQTKVEPGPNSAVHRDLDFAADRNSKAAHSPTLSDQQRRKSLAILQNITHSASQKIKSLIRTPAGLRRKSAMSISPLVMMDTSASTPLASLAFESQIESCPVEREGGYPDLVLQLQHQHHKMPESAKLIFKSSHIDDRKNEPVVPTEKGRISSPIEQSDGRSDSLAL